LVVFAPRGAKNDQDLSEYPAFRARRTPILRDLEIKETRSGPSTEADIEENPVSIACKDALFVKLGPAAGRSLKEGPLVLFVLFRATGKAPTTSPSPREELHEFELDGNAWIFAGWPVITPADQWRPRRRRAPPAPAPG